MIPFLLAAVPLTPLQSHPPQAPAAQASTVQASAVQPSSRSGTWIAAQPSSNAGAVCPAPSQAQALANSTGPRAAGNNFNLAGVTALFPTSLASRPAAQALSVPLTTGRYAAANSDNSNNNAPNTPPPCSTGTTLVATVNPIAASNLAATPRQAGLGFALAGSSASDALYDPSGSSEADLSDLLGQNSDYSLTAYQKRSGFNRRLNGWLTFDTIPSSVRELRGQSSSASYLVGSITLTFKDADGSSSKGVDYPILHVANLGGSPLQTGNGSSAGSLSSQLKLSKINGEAAPANAVAFLSGRNLAVGDNLLSNSAADTKAFGSATIKGEGIRTLTFDVYVKGNGTTSGSTFPDTLSAGQDRFFLTLTDAQEAALAYGYGSVQAGVGFPGTYSGTFSILGVPGQRNTLDLNTGFNGELALGYRGPRLRSDLSVGYSSFGNQRQTIGVYNSSGVFGGSVSAPGTGSVGLFTVMANGYLDFKMRNEDGAISRWSPYIGAGIGLGSLNSPNCSLPSCTLVNGGSGSGFAYQLKAGISYRANETSRFFLEGGYLGLTGTRAGNVDYDAFGTWRLNLGWRQAF